ncbi:dethiobiotin synthase [Rhodoferax sp.]|uniref:dethiobiotin synthase n=1 Tax=Rhodoferax sp. TaxID=50421 RepID=UPI002628883C|nr:dethiobiotin synthase [Rhodoferax sp.]MDD2919641.1 dethiobiotin synthase [Rhodoferax sp.]
MRPNTALNACFVTGTDTEVGKTRISAALLHWLARNGFLSAAFKPVAAGTSLIDGQWVNEDVRALREASALTLSDAEVGPFQFEAACAPHIAASLQRRTIDRNAILRSAHALAARADVLVVEGVGGFCVPLGDDWDSADLACDLKLPVVLVVGLRLGCINHALLTAEAVRARGLSLAGWVGNSVSPGMAWLDKNVTTLRQRFQKQHIPCWGCVPWLAEPTPAAVAAHLDQAALRAFFSSVSPSLVSSLKT